MLRKLMILLLAVVLGSFFSASESHAERRVALVIGNANYANAPGLRNPRNDASDMAEALQKMGFEVVLGLDLDQQRFAVTVQRFARMLDEADVALFYYAGHGLQISGKNYLVSVGNDRARCCRSADGSEGADEPRVSRCLPKQSAR
jgi:hypothetical protein